MHRAWNRSAHWFCSALLFCLLCTHSRCRFVPQPRFPSFRAPLSPLHTPLPSPHFGPAHPASTPSSHSSALVSSLLHTLWNIGPDSAKLSSLHRSCSHVSNPENSCIDEAKCIDTIKNPSRWCCANCETSNSIRMCLACGECACERHSYLHFESHRTHPMFLQLNAESKPCFCYDCRFVVAEDNEARSLATIREVLEHVQNLNIEILSKTTRSGRRRIDSTQQAAAAAAAAVSSASSSAPATAAAAALSAPSTSSVLSGMLSPDADASASGASTLKASWGRVRKWQKVLPFLSKQAQAARRTEDSLRTVLFRWRNRHLVKSFLQWKYWTTTGKEARLKRRAEKEAAKRAETLAAGGPGALKRKFADDLPMLSFDLSHVAPEGSDDDDASDVAAGGAKLTRSTAAASKRSKLVHPATASASSNAATAAASAAATAGLMLPPPPRRPKRSRSEERQKPPAPDPDVMPPPGGLGLRRQPSLSADDLLSPPGSANARRKASASARCSPKGSRSASPRPGSKAASGAASKLPVIKLSKGVMGLRNLGNTCYLNSVVQALSLTPLFRQYYTETIPKLLPPIKQNERHLLNARAAKNAARKKQAAASASGEDEDAEDSDSDSDDEEDHSSLSRDFSALLSTIWEGSKIQYTPDHFLQTVWTLYERFRGFKQQDAQEFVLFLMNQLSREQELQVPEQKLETQYKHPLWARAHQVVRNMIEQEKKNAAASAAAATRNNNTAPASSASGKKRKKGDQSIGEDKPASRDSTEDPPTEEEHPSSRRRSGRASTVVSTTSSSSLAHQGTSSSEGTATSGSSGNDAKYPPIALPLELKHLESIPLVHAATMESPPPLPHIHAVPKSILSRSEDFIAQNFAGVIRNAIKCQECDHVSATETGFLGMISVEIPPRAFSDPSSGPEEEGDATMGVPPSPSPSGSRSMVDRERGLHHSASSMGISGGNPSASFMSISRALHHSRSDSLSLKDKDKDGADKDGSAQAALHMSQQESLRKKHHATSVTLQKCLAFTFNNPEILEGANAYACSGCCAPAASASSPEKKGATSSFGSEKKGAAAASPSEKKGVAPAGKKLVRAEKSTCIAALPPEYLFIHIGRTVYDMSTFSSKKDQTHIAFPLKELDMSACFAQQPATSNAAAGGVSSGSHLYDLYAVVNHHGRGLNEGHFTSFGYSEEHGQTAAQHTTHRKQQAERERWQWRAESGGWAAEGSRG